MVAALTAVTAVAALNRREHLTGMVVALWDLPALHQCSVYYTRAGRKIKQHLPYIEHDVQYVLHTCSCW
jgi:hypothetical protein